MKSLIERLFGVKIKKAAKTQAMGILSMKVYGSDGQLKHAMMAKNLIPNVGLAAVAARIGGISMNAFTYLALGTGATAPAAGDTTLQTEATTGGLGRVNASVTRVTTTVTNDTLQLSNTFSVSTTATITEAGILNAASVGDLLSRLTFTGVPVTSGDTLAVVYQIKVENA